ncbi:ABC transporter ATP-binding protein [Glycomyces buryatensis]|uniref:ABC transporter ATP-binding protein n=1 Tax=Glycomyces buryatensis TaxID=2570927 RepID=A0A4S8Q3D4_9ACTN|nr:ABC transporter ATP-binding protein [Glycomyces buryatensis]THV38693.1 ABC transporter ATP-binding protein [Glycomyces buryatensis]
MALLEVENLRAGYGSVPVLHGVSLSVDEGSNAVLLGLNGAGKSTTLMALAGLLPTTGGEIRYDGKPLTGTTGARVRAGIVLVPEGRHVFPALTVRQNLRLGAWTIRRDTRTVRGHLNEIYSIFPRLEERADQLAGTLSGGEQQMLAIGRGLMSSPRLLLIDEASLGLSPKLTEQVFAAVQLINERGVTVLMVEQNAGVLAQADTAFVMQQGRITMAGSGSETLEDDAVRAAYFGT